MFLGARHHFAHLGERLQRRAVVRVHRQVPGPQPVQFQLPAALVLDVAHGGHDFTFNGLVKFHAIGRRVIEPAFLPEGVIAVIIKPGVAGDLRAQLDQFVENLLALFGVLQAALGHQLPSLLPQGAVGFLQIAAHLHERLFLAAELHRLRADQLLILLA